MTESTLNPPDAEPPIPEGLATKAGKILTAAIIVLAVLVEVDAVALEEATRDLIEKAIIVYGIVAGGRYAQATAGRIGRQSAVLGEALAKPAGAAPRRSRRTAE